MERGGTWLLTALVVVALAAGAVIWHRGRSAPDEPASEPPAAADDDSADLPTRVETEDQMRSIGYVQ